MSFYNKIRRAIARKIINKKVHLNLSEPIISFTFDDVPDSAFTNGAGILRKYGYVGTYYVALSFFEKNRSDGIYFDPQYLKEVIKDGGELACHTYNHIHFYRSNKRQIEADLKKNQEKLNELVPNYKFTNFSYPYGEQTVAAKRVVRDRYKSARGVNSGINYDKIDIINLKAYQLGNTLKLEDAIALIEQTIELKGWLIFFTHDVEKNHSKYGCTPELLQGVADYCSRKNLTVLTVQEAMEVIMSR